jgi:beta-mannanase
MLLRWFDARNEKKFGTTLAQFFIERSAATSPDKPTKFIEKKQEELLSKLTQQLLAFKQNNQLNIYKKAQVGNAFKWTLKDAGFDNDYVDQLTSWLMLRF